MSGTVRIAARTQCLDLDGVKADVHLKQVEEGKREGKRKGEERGEKEGGKKFDGGKDTNLIMKLIESRFFPFFPSLSIQQLHPHHIAPTLPRMFLTILLSLTPRNTLLVEPGIGAKVQRRPKMKMVFVDAISCRCAMPLSPRL